MKPKAKNTAHQPKQNKNVNPFNKKNNHRVNTIMIADDDLAIIDVVTIMLESKGYKVFASADGQTVNDVNNIHPDLILLDILMSGISGYEICKKLKTQETTKNIPIIMISANKDAEEIALDACADDFITKPFEMDLLLKKVAKYC